MEFSSNLPKIDAYKALSEENEEEYDYFNTKARKTTSIDSIIGSNIRAIRLFLGYTQNSLSELLGVTFQQIQKYEQGANRISASKLWELAIKLNIKIENFFPQEFSAPIPKKLTVNEKHAEFFDDQNILSKNSSIHSKEILQLIKSYNRIPDPMLKKKLIALIGSFSNIKNSEKRVDKNKNKKSSS